MTTSAAETIPEGRARFSTKVRGMQCWLCVGILERRLHAVSGVEQVSISLSEQEARVEYDPGRVSAEQLRGGGE